MPPNRSRAQTYAVFLLLLCTLIGGCGTGGSGLNVFRSTKTISVEGLADIEVVAPIPSRVASVTPLPNGLTVARGGVAVFSASAHDSQGRLLTNLTYSWRMHDPAAGSVSSNGVFTAGNVPGDYPNAIEVVATQTIGGREFTAIGRSSVLVTSGLYDTTISSVIVFPHTASGLPGEYVPLRAAVIGNNGGLVQDVNLFWRVTDPRVGTIDQSGGLTLGDTPGNYPEAIQVQARRLGGSEAPVIANASVTILSKQEAAGGVKAIIGPSAVIARPGSRIPLVLLTVDQTGQPIPSGNFTWTVLDPDVGTVTQNGMLTLGDTPGTYPSSVEGTAALRGDYSGQTVSAKIDVVVQQPQTSGSPSFAAGETQIFPQTLSLTTHDTVQLSVITYDDNGNPVTAKNPQWEYDETRFTVDSRGRLTATAAPGVYPDALTAKVTKSDGSVISVSKSVTVLGTLARVSISPDKATLEGGQFVQFLAQGYDSAGNILYDVRFKWSLTDGAPGTITSGGLYVAQNNVGTYPGAVKVVATQLVPK